MTTTPQVTGIERWECPRHGEHTHFVSVVLFKSQPPPTPHPNNPNVFVTTMPQEKILERRYCTQCLIEFLDKHKITEMEPVRPRK